LRVVPNPVKTICTTSQTTIMKIVRPGRIDNRNKVSLGGTRVGRHGPRDGARGPV
jgi:hypothetical protein